MKGWFGAIWGIVGTCAIIVDALIRITPIGVEAYQSQLSWVQWVALAVWVPAMLWMEGYRGFHLSFSPMVASRARYLRDHPVTLHVLLAPVFCSGLIHATRRRLIRSSVLVVGIVAIILLVRELPQPWRGIVDLGVVGGLGFGMVSLLYHSVVALRAPSFDVDPEVPAGTV